MPGEALCATCVCAFFIHTFTEVWVVHFFLFWQYWGLSSGSCTCYAGALLFEPFPSPVCVPFNQICFAVHTEKVPGGVVERAQVGIPGR
jgi:hypothetical protein